MCVNFWTWDNQPGWSVLFNCSFWYLLETVSASSVDMITVASTQSAYGMSHDDAHALESSAHNHHNNNKRE